MAVFFAIFDRVSNGTRLPAPAEFEGAKSTTGEIQTAKVIEVEATTEKEVADFIQHFYGGDVAANVNIVTNANFKEQSF